MILVVIAFLGGALTILSPCILPVLPFVFARADRSFARSTLPLLFGMALTFAAIATLAAIGGGWAVRINAYGRVLALILLGVFGAALLSRRIADWIAKPFVTFGNRLLENTHGNASAGALQSFVIGIATGFLWAPCAGPILGLILTGAAISGPNAQTTLLLFAYALGAIASLAIATRASASVFAALKRSFNSGEWIRRILGVAVIAAVIAIAFGLDTGALTRLSLSGTNRLEQSLLDKFQTDNLQRNDSAQNNSNMAMTGANSGAMTNTNSMTGTMTGGAMMSSKVPAHAATDEGELPELNGAVAWLNSPPLTAESLRGKVVLIDFWTYSCINCLRTLPYVKAWAERYKDNGLVVIGVHSPEFAFEKDENNVHRAVRDLGITYPVALDNNYAIWQAFNNRYWPAHYFIDATGRIRGHHFGEGNYEESEQLIRQLLSEADTANAKKLPLVTQTQPSGTSAAADEDNVKSPETYIGYERAENFGSPETFARDQLQRYTTPNALQLNQWALGGKWFVDAEKAVLNEAKGTITYRFHARDLHLVLGAGGDKPIRFRVTIDGAAPGKDHGLDTDENGVGVVHEQRLYQLVRQSDAARERTFTIEFLDAGVQAYSFTFG